MGLIRDNLGTIVISLLLATAVILIILKMVRDKRKGKSSCGCGCEGCAMRNSCHSPAPKKMKDA